MKVWDVRTGNPILSHKGHVGDVTSVAFTPDGRHVISASQDKTLKVWDAGKASDSFSFKGHRGAVSSVAYSPDGSRIVSAGADRALKVWDGQTGSELLSLQGRTGWDTGMAISPDGQRIVNGNNDNTLQVWNARTGRVLLSLKGHTDKVVSVTFSPDGQRIVSGSRDKTLKVWDSQTGNEIRSLQGHRAVVNAVAYSPDGQRIVSASHDSTLKVWDSQTGSALLTLKGHRGAVMAVAISPDGKRIVSGSGDFTLKVWDSQTGSEVHSLQGHTDWITSVAYSPDGKRIVSGSYDGTLRVWDSQTGSETLTLTGHSVRVGAVAFSSDGQRIVSGSQDGVLKIWDSQLGSIALTLKGHSGKVQAVAFSADSAHVIGKDVSGRVLVWDVHSGRLLPEATAVLPAAVPQAISPNGRYQAVATGATIQLRLVEAQQKRQARQRAFLENLGCFDPTWHRAQAVLGETEGQPFAAAFHLSCLLREYPWDAELHVRKAYALARQGQATESSLQLLTALFLHPQVRLWPLDPQAHLRAWTAAQADDWPGAVAAFRSAVQQPGAPPLLWRDLLLAQAAAGQSSACRQTIADIVRLLPEVKDPAVVNALQFICEAFPWDEKVIPPLLERSQRGLEAQRTAVTLQRRGAALYRGGQYKQALNALEESIQAHGKGGGVNTWLFQAMACQKLGQPDQAKKHLERFEQWHQKQQFTVWQDRVFLGTLLREARSVVNGPD